MFARIVALFALCAAITLAASEARVERILADLDEAVNAAQEERDETVAKANERLRGKFEDERQDALKSLRRLIRSSDTISEQAAVHRAILGIDRSDEDAVAFFTTLKTLDRELAALDDPQDVDTSDAGVDLLAAKKAPGEGPGQPLWSVRFEPELLKAGKVRNLGRSGIEPTLEGSLQAHNPTFTRNTLLKVGHNGIPIGAEWTLALVGTFPINSRRWATLAQWNGNQQHVAISNTGEIGVLQKEFFSAGQTVNFQELSGRHCLVAVANQSGTAFYLDGRHIGTAAAMIPRAITTIGNNAGGKMPWQAPVELIMVFDQAYDAEAVRGLAQQLLR
ncbi:MAG: hypothetical protein PF961_04640 [Planctomycetota bacterium]|jgi:hypothetical protein|nr:hypothetical protein [Planctomycetota bacterium]